MRERREGTRRLYRLNRAGVEELRAYFDEFWSAALEEFRAEAERRERRQG